MKQVTFQIDLTAVQADDARRLFDRMADRNGKPRDCVRVELLKKLQREAHRVETLHRKFGHVK